MFYTSKRPWPYMLFIVTVFISVLAVPILFSGIFEYRNYARKHIDQPIYYSDRAVVLIYHDFADRESGVSISPKHFEQHLDMLKREHFNIISLEEIAEFLDGQGKLPPNAVAITIDDGYQSNYYYAYPILKARHLPATIFMIAGSEGQPADRGKVFLTPIQLSKMAKDNITIDSHTYQGHSMVEGSYPTGKSWITTRLPGETRTRYLRRLTRDLSRAKQTLDSQLGQNTNHLAWPFGSYNKTSIQAAHRAGYTYLWTTRHFPITAASSKSELGRISVGRKSITVGKLKSMILQVANNKPAAQPPSHTVIRP